MSWNARRRTQRTLAVLVVLVVAGGLTSALLLVRHATRPTRSEVAEGFLRNVRDGQWPAAFKKLCPAEQDTEGEADFVSRLTQARAGGRGRIAYRYSIPFDRESISSPMALGTATFADGTTGDVTLGLADRKGGGTCVSGWRLDPVVRARD